MPRDGSGVYTQPLPDVVPATTIASTVYNGFVNDVETDLNQPRPLIAGGTGATNAATALYNVGGEKATQVVTNWDSQVWVPGSFYAAASATGSSPTAGRAFAGTVYIGETLANPPTNQNVVLEARDLDYPTQPGPLYARQKKAGVWSAWTSGGGSAAPFDALAYNGMQINGSMIVSQESGNTVTSVSGYVCDGWAVYFMGTTVAKVASTSGGPAGIPSSIQVNTTTAAPSPAAGDLLIVYQNIEGYRIARLAFGTVSAQSITIAFWTCHHRVGVYCVSLQNGPNNRSCIATYTQNVADTWEYKTITFPPDTAGTWAADNTSGMTLVFTIIAGSNFIAPSAGVWSAGNYKALAGTVNASGLATDSFRLTGVVVLPGIEAPSAARSPFIMRPFDQELVTCQRYYEKSYDYAVLPATPFGGGSTGGWQYYHPTGGFGMTAQFRTAKRATPTVVIYDGAGTSNKVTYFASGAWNNGGAISAQTQNQNNLYLQHAIASSNFTQFGFAADARL